MSGQKTIFSFQMSQEEAAAFDWLIEHIKEKANLPVLMKRDFISLYLRKELEEANYPELGNLFAPPARVLGANNCQDCGGELHIKKHGYCDDCLIKRAGSSAQTQSCAKCGRAILTRKNVKYCGKCSRDRSAKSFQAWRKKTPRANNKKAA